MVIKQHLSIVESLFSLFFSDYTEIYGTVHWQRIQVLVSIFLSVLEALLKPKCYYFL